jgi:hypothetical protein
VPPGTCASGLPNSTGFQGVSAIARMISDCGARTAAERPSEQIAYL